MATARKAPAAKRTAAPKKAASATEQTRALKRELSDLKKQLRSTQADLRAAERREQKMQNVMTCMQEIQKISDKANRVIGPKPAAKPRARQTTTRRAA